MIHYIGWLHHNWEELCEIVHSKPEKYKAEFCVWLKGRLELWDCLVQCGLYAVERNDPYGGSVIFLLSMIDYKFFSDGIPIVQEGDYRFARDLGRLLIDIHPETHESLWRGERYFDPIIEFAGIHAKIFKGQNPERKKVLVEYDDHWHEPEFMVFPELANLPWAVPYDGCGHA